jgi:ectoine hydroxylase-related dioxygenase (phytanoyl-CoA dioxygenase family)
LSQFHIKLLFYLDPMRAETGALRVIPGTSHYQDGYAKRLRRVLLKPNGLQNVYGLDALDVPSWTIESEPGDLLVTNFRTIHASLNGGARRRLFTMNFRQLAETEA